MAQCSITSRPLTPDFSSVLLHGASHVYYKFCVVLWNEDLFLVEVHSGYILPVRAYYVELALWSVFVIIIRIVFPATGDGCLLACVCL